MLHFRDQRGVASLRNRNRAEIRLQNSRVFFSKSVKKKVKCGVRVLRARASYARRARSLPSLAHCFQPCFRPSVWLLARTWIRKNTDCFAVYAEITDFMCEQKPYPVWFSPRRKVCPVYCEHSLSYVYRGKFRVRTFLSSSNSMTFSMTFTETLGLVVTFKFSLFWGIFGP